MAGVNRPLLFLSALVLSASAAAAEAQDSTATGRWPGASALPRDDLFTEFSAWRAKDRSITEPVLDGEALPELLTRLDVPADEAEAAANAFLEAAGTNILPEGTSVRLRFMNSPATVFQREAGSYPRALLSLEALVDDQTLVQLTRSGSGFTAETVEEALRTRFVAAAGEIDRSLFAASANAGVPRDVMIRFADVFAFDVDFAREIFRGDRFEIVYEVKVNAAGEEVGTGEIVFAGLTWKGGKNSKGYYRYQAEGAEKPAYYDASGRDPRTLLMKTPINGARVTSRFGRRRHPVLGYDKGHKGIDFGAPRGTPILAAGDGVVKLAGPRGTFGNYIRIEHAAGYETAYAHLQGFAKGLKSGKRVRQGEVIGYVGTTGRSTGPHLHYEVLKSGEPQNPETVKVAVGVTLTEQALAAFREDKQELDGLRTVPFAIAERTLP
jgi:murein DD-endopeptidase MepM/ murein hydrolase activator NlpD